MRAPPRLLPALVVAAWLCTSARGDVGKPVAPQVAGDGAFPAAAGAIPVIPVDEPLGEPQFNTTPNPLPPNVPSVGFEATATSEFGDLVRLVGPTHFVSGVTLTLSSHAIRSDFPAASAFGYSHPITLKIYAADRRTGTPAAGALLTNVTRTFLIPWRPEPDPGSSSPLRPWRGTDGNFYSGIAFLVTFDLGPLALSLPDEVILAVAFNTEHSGDAPLGAPGPWNHLHVGVTNARPTQGTNPDPEAVFWKTARAANYSDSGAAGVNILRRDTGWASFQPAFRINDSPYGMLASTAAMLRNLPSDDVTTIVTLVEASDLIGSALERSLWEGHDRLRSLWGRLVFDLLAEASEPLARFAQSEGPVSKPARAALDILLAAAQSLVETAVGDAVIAAGNAHRIARAQDAFEAAGVHEQTEAFERALDQLANAWREAQLSLR